MKSSKHFLTLFFSFLVSITAQANSNVSKDFTSTTSNETNYYMPPTEICDNGIDDDGDSFVDCDDLDCVTVCSEDVDYCYTEAENNYFEWIDRIQVNDFVYQSGQGFLGYDDFSMMTIELDSESPVNLVLDPGYVGDTYEEFWCVWIDLNKNGDFEDEGELVYKNSKDGELSDVFYVPAVTEEISTMMRVSMKYESFSECCGMFDFGEVEDYNVVLKPINYEHDLCVPSNDIAGDWIESVTVNQINNTSGANQGYGDFSNLTSDLQKGEIYQITLDPGAPFGNSTKYWKVWIDIDQNGEFSGKFELVVDTKSSTTVTKDFMVPAISGLGETRMRVVMSNLPDVDPCGVGFNGEVEDYTVEVIAQANLVGHIKNELEASQAVEIRRPEVTLYPNPSSEFVNIDASQSEVALKTVLIFTVDGRMIENRNIHNSSVTSIGLANYEKGNYYMMIIDENNQPTYHNFAVLK